MISSLLIASLLEEVLPLVVGKKTSKDIWNTLATACSASSETQLMSLHMALQDLKQKEDEPVNLFLQCAKTIFAELQAAGDVVRPSTFNMHIYRGLKPKFQSIISSRLTRPTTVEYDDLHVILISHEFLQGTTFNKVTISETFFDASNPQTNALHRGQRSSSQQSQSFRGHERHQ
ncbi:hypothetical protein Droror1_Dr00021100 [Drosera rotundifolia]